MAAVKGVGGFHLAADATNAEAVRRLRERKHRVEKPFAVMVPDLATAGDFCEFDAVSRQLLTSAQRPIVLLPWKRPSAIAGEVAPGNNYLGLFLPYTPLHHLLFAKTGARALVMTSANLSEEPIVIGNGEAVERLKELADCLLVHNREILLRCDDSVMRVSGGRPRQLRRSRGFVPVPVFLLRAVPSILAVGGELKNTICLTKGKHAFLSQHIGDLENFESYRFFEEAITHLAQDSGDRAGGRGLRSASRLFFDALGSCSSREWKLVGVQHHHAHIASCMAEHHLEGRVIGFALDGTGYGTDRHIWGGEAMVAGYEDFRRVAHLDYVKLPGGAAAIREPWRMAVSYLAHHFGSECAGMDIPFLRALDPRKLKLVLNMMKRGVNSPLTSSCGRLFDAVAALAGVRQMVNYEAQAAIELENAITEPASDSLYPLNITLGNAGPWIIDTKSLFIELVEDIRRAAPLSMISAKFHQGLVEVFARIARQIREREGLNRVCLSGGTFQNRFLSERLQTRLAGLSFEVFAHSEVPAGDGGLSLGQAMVAAHRAR